MLAAIDGAFHRAIKTLTINLSTVASVTPRHKGLRVVKKVLSSINTSVSPVSALGFFTRSDNDFKVAKELMKQGEDLVKRRAVQPGLLEIELDNAAKITNASGRLAFAYFSKETYPWLVDQTGCLRNPTSAPSALGRLFSLIAAAAGYSRIELMRMNVDHFGVDGPSCYYKKGSSYGLCPYVPGKSKKNSLALLYHNVLAAALAETINGTSISGAEEVIKLIDGIQNDYASGDAYHPFGGKIMMISRARPMGLSKPIPHWRVNYHDKTLTATSEEAGFRAGTREIKAVPAFVNLLFSPYAGLFSNICRQIPGLHVGHQILSASFLRACLDSWGNDLTLHVEDISGYDNSVNSNHLSAFRSFMRVAFEMNDKTDAYLRAVDQIDIATARLFDDDPETITLLKRRDGIASGFQGTTMYGTGINLILIVDALSHLLGVTPDAILKTCANFQKFLDPSDVTLRNSKWGLLLKGDDLILFSRAGYVNWSDFAAVRSEQGIKTDVEPGPIFLMQYMDLKRKLTGRDYPYCPKSLLNVKTLESYGLILKRLGNRLIFNEHPITDERVARLAVVANLEDTFFHPCYDFLEQALLSRLNHYDSKKWSNAGSLRRYMLSEEGKKDMMDYAAKKGSSDPFLRELLRRKEFFEGLDDDDNRWEVGVTSALPPWADEVLSSIGEITLPSLTQKYDLSDEVINASVEDTSGQGMIIKNDLHGRSREKNFWSSARVKQYGRKIFKILTDKEND